MRDASLRHPRLEMNSASLVRSDLLMSKELQGVEAVVLWPDEAGTTLRKAAALTTH